MGSQILSKEDINRLLDEIACKVVKHHQNEDTIYVIGIYTRGYPLAKRLAQRLKALGKSVKIGSLDITFYRDDLTMIDKKPVIKASKISPEIDDKVVLLVDDVIFTGRTVRAALCEIMDYGRPKRIELAVLIDRGGREVPIEATYVGKKVEISRDYIVDVKLTEVDGTDGVWIFKRS